MQFLSMTLYPYLRQRTEVRTVEPNRREPYLKDSNPPQSSHPKTSCIRQNATPMFHMRNLDDAAAR